jgi:nucleoid-associated protein YgaU
LSAIALTHASATKSAEPAGSRPQFKKASLTLHEAKPAVTGGSVGAPIGKIAFQFNPKELAISKSAKWERKPARGAKRSGPPEFGGAEPAKLTLEMFFDASFEHDDSVVASVEKLLSCCVPTDQSIANKKETPPLVVLRWGSVTAFAAYISSVSVKYSLFAPDGTPIRATCSVTMEEMPGVLAGQNPTSGALETRRVHTVVTGDTLASVAYREYGDPTMWRVIAAANGIDDPLRIPAGTALQVPAPDERRDR